MKLKKFGRCLLFPPIAISIVLIPIATVFLVYSMAFLGTESPAAIVSYVIAAYTLTIWCVRTPYLIRFLGTFKNENKYARRWQDDTRLRVNIALYGTLIWNTAYAVFQLGLGLWHHTFWFCSMAGYYIALAVMRFFLVRYTSRNNPGEKMKEELLRYRTCGWVFLLMNLALSVMVFFMVYWDRTFHHNEITTITMATYTFTAFTVAVINILRYRKYNSPVYSASKAIGLAAACVSMLTLESTMLTTFGKSTTDALTRKILLGVTGGVVSVFIIIMAIYMVAQSSKKLKALKQ